MIWVTRQHTIQNAQIAGLMLCEPDEYGVPEWLGSPQQHATFKFLEADENLE